MTTTGRPRLSRTLVLDPAFRDPAPVDLPGPALLELPEKVVQFGTGALLRGLIQPFIDAANRQASTGGYTGGGTAAGAGLGGRVVVVGSTGSGRVDVLTRQDGLYTLAVQGLRGGEPVRERRVIAAISRALSARDHWADVLALAHQPDLELVFSNTTEVGIALHPDDLAHRPGDDEAAGAGPPRSFPAKLTRFLLERARARDFDPAAGLVVVPCELIEDNGDKLQLLVYQLAAAWGIEPAFEGWLDHVHFANTLVDRIVPGTPPTAEREALEAELGYRDDLLTVCEPYRLLAIQVDPGVRPRLARAFADADPGVVLTDDLAPFRERKIRLLNGTHTLMVPLALLRGHATVHDAMADADTGAFVRRLLRDELVPTLDVPGAGDFADHVLDRFANPFIRHALFDITLQSTTKMRVRVLPSLLRYGRRRGEPPPLLAFAFAAFLLFHRGDLQQRRRDAGLPVPPDDAAGPIDWAWFVNPSPEALVPRVLGDQNLWDGVDLTTVPGFTDAVREALERLLQRGPDEALRARLSRTTGE